MAYFNHAFRKTFLATGANNGISPLANGTVLGTSVANTLAAGQITFIDPQSWQIRNTPGGVDDCCELILASGALMDNDKIGPFHGGYKESNKSKVVKSKYVSRLYAAPANLAQNYVLHAGITPWTIVPANAPNSSEPGETSGTCCKKFLCGETYYLRLDVKGSPALRTLNHNAYETLEAYTGCCADDTIAPTPVDPRRVFIQWAQQIVNDPIMKNFVFPVVTFTNDNGTNWTYYYPDNVTKPASFGNVTTLYFSQWTEAAYAATMCAGMVLNGAYVETKFENCTFQVTDFYEVEPLRIYASEVDYTGSPCEFEALCIGVQCYGRQLNGIGETVVRDLILSEAYRQNHFATDLRIREITQGNDILNATGLSRTAYYDRIFIQHNVPRFYNPTGTFDNDQYLLEIVTPNPNPTGTLGAAGLAIYNLLTAWLTACGSSCNIETLGTGTACAASSPAVPLPTII
jgi:hypothetical protein